MVALDVDGDFELSPDDVVAGLRIGFGVTASQTDFAGAYITDNALAVSAPFSADFDRDGDVDHELATGVDDDPARLGRHRRGRGHGVRDRRRVLRAGCRR